jgi:hypothetical protein
MNPTYQINQAAESQPDADDSIVPISSARRTFPFTYKVRPARWKMGMVNVDKQGDKIAFISTFTEKLCGERVRLADWCSMARRKQQRYNLKESGKSLIVWPFVVQQQVLILPFYSMPEQRRQPLLI